MLVSINEGLNSPDCSLQVLFNLNIRQAEYGNPHELNPLLPDCVFGGLTFMALPIYFDGEHEVVAEKIDYVVIDGPLA